MRRYLDITTICNLLRSASELVNTNLFLTNLLGDDISWSFSSSAIVEIFGSVALQSIKFLM